MTKYVLQDNYSGLIWHEVEADDPIEAARKTDIEVGTEGEAKIYRHQSGLKQTTESGYLVYEAPADWVSVADGMDGAEIARVEALPLVAQIAVERASP